MRKDMFYTLSSEKDKSLPIYLVSVGRFPGQNEVLRPVGMPFHQIFVVTAGRGTYTCAGKTYSLLPGSCFYVPKGTAHHYYGTDEAFTTRWVAFDGENIAQVLAALGLDEGCCFDGGLKSDFYYAQAALLEQAKQNADNTVLSAYAYSALVAFVQQRSLAAQGSNALEHAREYMSTHCAEALTLDDIAAEVHMSKYNFCRAFKKQYGVTPFEYLLQLRVLAAKQLLASRRDLSVAQIAIKVGFSDAGYFIKCFKKLERITPLEFRKTRI